MFKKVNLESKGYKAFRSVVGIVSGTGAGLTFECMSIPMVYGVLQKNRVLRLISYAGIVPIATIIDLIGKGAAESIVDSFAETYNLLVDKYQKDDEEDFQYVNYTAEPEVEVRHTYMGIDIPDKNATPAQEQKFVGEVVLKTRVFEFDSEEAAMGFATAMTNVLTYMGPLSMSLVLKWREWDVPSEARDILDKYGWTNEDIAKIAYEKTMEDTWVVDAFNYHDISDQYVVFNKGDK